MDPLDAAALRMVTNETNLSIVNPAALPQIVEDLNQAFNDFANSVAQTVSESRLGERRDWCAGLTRTVGDLQLALGYPETSMFFEKPTFNADEILAKGWPSRPQSKQERERRAELVSALQMAIPDKYALGGGVRSDAEIDGDRSIVLARLGPALRIVVSLAQAAQDVLGAEKPGAFRDDGRRLFMNKVVLAYIGLFGKLPTASPNSAGHRWIAALIEHVGQIGGKSFKQTASNSSPEQQARMAAFQALENLAGHVGRPGFKMKTGGMAKLDHWIRQAVASPEVQVIKARSGFKRSS